MNALQGADYECDHGEADDLLKDALLILGEKEPLARQLVAAMLLAEERFPFYCA